MDPHFLRTFVTVAECGSFSAAASQLSYTQSAVSQQIAALEADLGAVLLHRRPVAVTEAGARLLEHARPILLRLDAARAEVARAAGSPPAQVTVGVTPLAAPCLVRVLAGALRAHPRADVTVRVAGRAAAGGGLATGSLDLAVVDGVAMPGDPLRLPDTGPATTVGITEQELVVVLPSGHPLAGWPGLRLADLADARWLDAPETGLPLADLRQVTASDGFRPSLGYQGTDVATLLTLVAAGHGLAVLPASALAGAASVTGVPVLAPPLVQRVELVHGTLTGPLAVELAARLTALAPGPPFS
ncbi:MAG TPA: LysR family transcriptional regulator [Streptosporangiaceae bacterium]